MTVLTVYRVHHRTNELDGPFTSRLAPSWSTPVSDDYPDIEQDCGGELPCDFVCGTRDMRNLRHWLQSDVWIHELHCAGFMVSVYSVPEHAIMEGKSGKQCAFRLTDSVKMSEMELFWV